MDRRQIYEHPDGGNPCHWRVGVEEINSLFLSESFDNQPHLELFHRSVRLIHLQLIGFAPEGKSTNSQV